jgi:thiamine-monophosphate kinase
MASESELIKALTQVFDRDPVKHPQVVVGIGDDAAVIKPEPGLVVLATDMAVEGVHFRRDWSSLWEIGAKIAAANLADIFSMGAFPKYLLVAAAIPADFTVLQIQQLATGIKEEATKVGAVVVGGDLARSENIVISISVFGQVLRPITRSGAKPGDKVLVSALPGHSAAGWALLTRGISDARSQQFRKPEVEYLKAKQIIKSAVTAMCDVSDGLVSELNHLSLASRVQINIQTGLFAENSAIASLKEISNEVGESEWNWILHGGEDHVFIATVPSSVQTPSTWIEIGSVSEGAGVFVDSVRTVHQGFNSV